ncbi:MAG: InlB B-repeat-containing protein [Eubacteriales bacterium]|nr:InlB B-repeat-containing protein [Eubacteriales bacterium]
MNKGRINIRGTRVLAWILVAVLLTGGIPVQAADFEGNAQAYSDVEDIFSAGETEDIFTDNAGDTETTVTPFPTGTPDETPSEKPQLSVTPEPDATLTPDVTPEVSLTPTPGVTDETDVTPTPEITPTPTVTPTPVPEGYILVRFAESKDNYYEGLDKMIRWDEEVELPDVPGRAGTEGNFWKLEEDKNLDNSILCEDAGTKVPIRRDEPWGDYMEDRVLTFYAAKKCRVTLYNNSGTSIYDGGILEAYEGQTVVLPDMPGSKYVNYGWTSVKGGREVEFELNSRYRILDDLDLYMIRYTALKVEFRLLNGSSNSAYSGLTITAVKGDKVKLPEIPQRTGYTGKGWSKTKNKGSVSYKQGQTITISGNMTLYAVQSKLPYSISFNNNSGTSTSKTYADLKMYAAKNQTITLPELPNAKGYQNVGWTTAKGKTTPVYKAGSKVKVTKNMKFYTVRRKSNYYNVEFFYGNGKSNSAYKKLKMRVEEGTEIKLPLVPARNGYINKGWSTRKNPVVATSRKTYTVRRNVKFYSVQVKAVKVTLYKESGDFYRSTTMAKGSVYTLPCVRNAAGYTFMGWSDKPKQSVNPQYEPEMEITVEEDMDLYAAVFRKSDEPDLPADKLPQWNNYKYKRVVFVGDSRTAYMENVLKNAGARTEGIEFISKVGGGLDWFKTVAYPKLYSIVKNETASILAKPTAVVINLGINDLENQNGYVLYMNSIAKELKKHNCELFFMSLNPVNRSMLKGAGKKDRSEAKVRLFNNALRSALGAQYSYIDTYSKLKKEGYGFDSSSTGTGGNDDGLHYTAKTYKRIFTYCMKTLG